MSNGFNEKGECIQEAIFIMRKTTRASSGNYILEMVRQVYNYARSCLVQSECVSASPSFNQFAHSASRACP
jgi:hypothetical protein